MGRRENSMLRHSTSHGTLRLPNYDDVRKTDIISERVGLILDPNNISLSFQKSRQCNRRQHFTVGLLM